MDRFRRKDNKNDLDLLHEIYFDVNDEKQVRSFGQKYNQREDNTTLVKSDLIPFNLPSNTVEFMRMFDILSQ